MVNHSISKTDILYGRLNININNNVINLSVTFAATFWGLSHCRCSRRRQCVCVRVFVQLLSVYWRLW